MRDQLLVLNFDNAYAAAITSKLRAERIACTILPGNTPVEHLVNQESLGLILAGGMSGQVPKDLDGQLLRAGMPVLALGDTAAAITALLGGQYEDALSINEADTLHFMPSKITKDLSISERLFDKVRPLVASVDLEPLATINEQVLGLMHKQLSIFMLGCQLEPNDPDIMSLLTQFAMDVCGATQWWSEDAFISEARAAILHAAGEGHALCLMSGGLNSGVAAMLAHRALGQRLTCLFIDTGLLRENEVTSFASYYKHVGLNLKVIDAADPCLKALSGLTGSSDKLAALYRCLQGILDQEMENLPHSLVVHAGSADGMLRDQSSRPLLPQLLARDKCISPISELFKDEIRLVGDALGMPQEMTRMQSFPWTGLALRIAGELTPEKLYLLRRADALFQDEIINQGLAKRLWKFFATLNTTTYKQRDDALTIVLRAVSASHQGSEVRALPARLPWDLLERYTERVLGALPALSQVVMDLTPSQSLQEIEWL